MRLTYEIRLDGRVDHFLCYDLPFGPAEDDARVLHDKSLVEISWVVDRTLREALEDEPVTVQRVDAYLGSIEVVVDLAVTGIAITGLYLAKQALDMAVSAGIGKATRRIWEVVRRQNRIEMTDLPVGDVGQQPRFLGDLLDVARRVATMEANARGCLLELGEPKRRQSYYSVPFQFSREDEPDAIGHVRVDYDGKGYWLRLK